ncbi:anaerobic dimethyl sulfoxide reductase subunit C (DMSO reductase anchor subunit) [Sanguibacter gelidistatuariae]|uniref:Anaerobic dimethyl sulfoxide reductase subunit C (DMSO reductase anchor subunit) n=1 Tax=Sanguibacter gelidistatuariae TaxID=1814289 RepID=A0A1G6GQA8_9MICO|nr:DmsC/YnfH family molybdoenzyme membrane anchor subunit [Sanguibacter gelidistatuariae]SDB84144.1 anaerobic dimethyl sulfoxide reductase subunit C (DMSO reductase anchor subunit) [Sanguibacter gelidistatuariae]
MNVHELPMILFTILAQMSVGAFVVLGIIQIVAARRFGSAAIDKVTDPALFAIGPVMVLGLIVSMFHMNDLTNTLNVLRHFDSSWLTREIVFGSAFAGLGFVFAFLQWKKWGSTRQRQALALVTAAVGLMLVTSMSMIYYSLITVPAWHTLATPAQFFTTTFLLGALAVGAALMGTVMWRIKVAARAGTAAADTEGVVDPDSRKLLTSILKGIGIAAVVLLGVEFIIIALHISNLAGGGAVAGESVAVFSGGWFIARLVLVFLGAGLLSVFVYRYASSSKMARPLAILATSAFALVLAGEFIGRSQFYGSMFRIGM